LPLCRGDFQSNSFPSSFSRLIFPPQRTPERKNRGQAGGSQYSHVEELQQVPESVGDGGEDFANAQVVWPVQERGRFAGRSRARGEALEKMRKYLTAGKPNSKNAAPATGCSGRAKPRCPLENHRSKLPHNQRLRKPLGGPDEPPL